MFTSAPALTRLSKTRCLRLYLNACRQIVNDASRSFYRARGTEIKIHPALDVKALQHKADALAKQLRLVDSTIQEWTWKTELL
ncbi:MAG: hypothetical protein J6I40_02445 [Mailhella sp.]|nr:hypothetical protein [Mailhella sp.]